MKQIKTDSRMELGDMGKWIGAAAAGALLMYIFDPERGRARRAYAAHTVRDAGLHTGDAIGGLLRSATASLNAARDSASAAYARADAMATRAGERIADTAHDLASSAADAASRTRGRIASAAEESRERSRELEHRLERNTWEARGRMDARMDAEADRARSRVREAASQARGWLDELVNAFDHRSPTLTNSALLGGGVLGLTGLARRSPLGVVLGLGALALLARSGGGARLAAMVRGQPSGSRIEVEKTIEIAAAPEEVYDAWSNYDNFPRFMSHVSEVHDLGHRRSHWVVKGPGGSEYSWNAVMTEQARPDHMAWRSEPGSEIEQEGAVSFEPVRGGTRVTVRMAYTPPGGALGHGLARMLGADPKRQMDDDLARMKSFIERGVTPYTSSHSPAGDRYLH
ncbi:SRPBCC family protein [Massilia sp. ZL223]|uniref:SRPBCC family protein n=1 Tax=Massilia sp. ZL223 TaxID=2824904 RepID=UPI001B80F58E|nr:SRPBCC family protein [Massilia sp. ZL223]MBQ5965710.1 SRPBCC family protein [Massilia sp. ZL223]